MSGVGFRCSISPPRNKGDPVKVSTHYFAMTSLGLIQGDDEIGLQTVLAALNYDEIKSFVQKSFRQLEKLIVRAALNGSNVFDARIDIELNLFQGWQIAIKDFAKNDLLFNSVQEFQAYLINVYEIEALPEEDEVDALAATIPGL